MRRFSNSIKSRLTARHKYGFKLCGSLKSKTVLDIGSSYGWFEKFALGSGAKKAVGIEPEEKYFYQAQREVSQALFKKGSALKIPEKNRSFDLVVMFDVLEHLPPGKEGVALREIKRVLRSGGALVISTPLDFWLTKLTDPAWYFGHRHYREEQLRKMLMKTGFKVKKVEKRGGFFEMVSALLLYFFKWIFNKEIPYKDFWDQKKDQEYFGKENGFMTIFIKATS
ncbi:MAG: class I SAM-dependent methyltransferase [Candidatus Shapirobacteria bacterium]